MSASCQIAPRSLFFAVQCDRRASLSLRHAVSISLIVMNLQISQPRPSHSQVLRNEARTALTQQCGLKLRHPDPPSERQFSSVEGSRRETKGIVKRFIDPPTLHT